jgi:hypothetical protein
VLILFMVHSLGTRGGVIIYHSLLASLYPDAMGFYDDERASKAACIMRVRISMYERCMMMRACLMII